MKCLISGIKILVVGGSSGIGVAIVQQLMKTEASIYMAFRSTPEGEVKENLSPYYAVRAEHGQ